MQRTKKEMISLNNLRICNHCGNVFSTMLENKTINRCPACNVWEKEEMT